MEYTTGKAGLRKDTAICFAYYDYRDSRLANISRIMAAFIKQLCQKRDNIPDNLLQIMRDARSPSLVGTEEYFRSLVQSFTEVFVVFDALDECPEQERQDVLGFITQMVIAPTTYRMKVFVTSRRQADIVEAFEAKRVPTLQILAENVAADIETFVCSRVEELQARKVLHINEGKLKEEVIQTLTRQAEGM